MPRAFQGIRGPKLTECSRGWGSRAFCGELRSEAGVQRLEFVCGAEIVGSTQMEPASALTEKNTAVHAPKL